MKVKVKEILKDYSGRDLKMMLDDKEVPLTVRQAINSAINGIVVGPNGQAVPLKAEDKGRIYQLSTKLWSAKKEVNLTVDEMAFIKERAKQVSNITPLVYGRICDLLEKK